MITNLCNFSTCINVFTLAESSFEAHFRHVQSIAKGARDRVALSKLQSPATCTSIYIYNLALCACWDLETCCVFELELSQTMSRPYTDLADKLSVIWLRNERGSRAPLAGENIGTRAQSQDHKTKCQHRASANFFLYQS